MDQKYLRAMELMEVPEEFYEDVRPMFRENEIALINLMGKEVNHKPELVEKILAEHIAQDPEELISTSYQRAVISKVALADGEIGWKVADLYTRYPYFAQFEPEKYGPVPSERKHAMNSWSLEKYISIHSQTIIDRMNGIGWEKRMHQGIYMTLEETFDMIDRCEKTIYVTPCNCKAMMYYHLKPTEVCIRLGDSDRINSQFDRGHGRILDKEEAKRLTVKFNREGLMQCGEGTGYCNCDGYACYPVHLSKRLGARGCYPKANYIIDWHEDECVNCGRCAKICNFGAFYINAEGKVCFDPNKCWGCTICSANCGKKAIHLIKKEA